MSKLGPISHFLSPVSCDLLVLQGLRCEWWPRWPRPYSSLIGQVPLRTGLAMVEQRSWVHVLSVISRGCGWEIDVWVLPALLHRLTGWGVSLPVLRPYAVDYIKLVFLAIVPEGDVFFVFISYTIGLTCFHCEVFDFLSAFLCLLPPLKCSLFLKS